MVDEPELAWEASLLAAMRDDLAARATSEMLDETLLDLLDPLDPAEAINVGKALSQIEKGASAVLTDPTVRQVAQVALPLAGGAIGTAAGGPVGAAAGAKIGTILGGAVAPAPPAQPNAGAKAAGVQALAAANTQNVQLALVAAALGPKGVQMINGIPVAALLAAMSTLFARAAAEVDQRARQIGTAAPAAVPAESVTAWDPPERHIYESLLAAESLDLAAELS
ncbi:hypothetical protein AB0F91_39750 [Amycolatopsis sp. NPDC023774]|uniref:hypothetical protein n=1 Tax=Amycolatopsis sp. NPDC023774 TaxID=3155015 RepID=UPI0034059A8B